MLSEKSSAVCVHGGHGLSHWVCTGCSDNGRCVVHRCRVVATGRLWGQTTRRCKTACLYGCPGVPDSGVHVCPRTTETGGAMVCRGVGTFASFREAQLRFSGSFLVHEQGPLVSVRKTSEFAFPHHIHVHIASLTVAVLLRVRYSCPEKGKISQHALVLPGGSNAVPLFPSVAPSYGSSTVRVSIAAISVYNKTLEQWPTLRGWSVHQLLAVQKSPCASTRWADITGAVRSCRPLPLKAERAAPRVVAGQPPVQPAFLRHRVGATCAHCGTFHGSLARFVAICAPEHPEIAVESAPC